MEGHGIVIARGERAVEGMERLGLVMAVNDACTSHGCRSCLHVSWKLVPYLSPAHLPVYTCAGAP